MTENIIHLVLARIPGGPLGTKGLSLFIVPKNRLENGELVFNDVHTVSLEKKMGIKGSSTCTLSFGDHDNCHGYLLKEPHQGMRQMFQMMNESRLNIAIQGVGQAGAAYQNALAYANERIQGMATSAGKDKSVQRVTIVNHPDVRDSLMFMKAITEGTRGACYATAYYTDLAVNGPQEMKEHYQDLVDIHVPIVKGYGTDVNLDVVSKGIQVLGGVGYTQDFPLEQNYRDLRIAAIYEGTNGIQALDLLGRKLNMHGGRLVQSLLREFETINLESTTTETLKEAVSIWQDYVGGLILLADDLKKARKEKRPEEQVLNATKILHYFGDVVIGFHLLKQGFAAEEKLGELGIQFSELQIQAKENPALRYYYNKLITVEYFALNILPRQEGTIRILKRGGTSALDAVLTVD